MVGSIKNRIAAFEDLAVTSKSTSKLMSILPPEQGFAASKNRSSIMGPQKGKETFGYVSSPVKASTNEANSKINNENTSMFANSRNSSNEKFNNDLDAYEKYRQDTVKAYEKYRQDTARANANASESDFVSTHSSQEQAKPVFIMNPPQEQIYSPSSKIKNSFAQPLRQAAANNPLASQSPGQELEHLARANTVVVKPFTSQPLRQGQAYITKSDHEHHSGHPVPIISVANSDNDDDEQSEGREQNISPLSFQSRKISSRASNMHGKLPDIPAIEEEPTFGEEQRYSGRSRDPDDTPSMEESEERNDVDEPYDNDIFLNGFTKQSHDLSIASGRDGTLGSCLSESQNDFDFALPKSSMTKHDDGGTARNTDSPKNIDGPTIDGQEEYDNFTLGSEDTEDFPSINDKMKGNTQLKENEKGNAAHDDTRASSYMPRNLHGNGEDSVSQQYESQENKKKTIDPLFLEDDSTDASGSDPTGTEGDDASFSEYIDNMRPVPSFTDDNIEDKYGDDKLEHNSTYDAAYENQNDRVLLTDKVPDNDYVHVRGEEEEKIDFEDDLSEKVKDDFLHTGQRMVQNINTDSEGLNSTRGDIVSDDYISGDDETFTEQANDNVLGIGGGIVQEFNNDDVFGNIRMEMMAQQTFNENVPFDEIVSYDEIKQQNGDFNEQMGFDDDLREKNNLSPVYYLEEDFEEDDDDDRFNDDETADDETGDLLGVNIDELSMISDVIESSFVNPAIEPTPQYSPQVAESTVKSNRKSASKFSFDSYQSTQDRIESMQAKMQQRNQSKGDFSSADESATDKSHLLTSIQEEQPTEPLAEPVHHPLYNHFIRENQGSGPPLTIQNSSNMLSKQPDDKSETDEISQMTDASTDEPEHRGAKWRTSHDSQHRGTQETKSEHSLMTYSLSETSSPSIVHKPQNGPIFRDRNSLSSNLKLRSTSSNISEITDPNPPGFRRRLSMSKGGKKNNNEGGSGLSTIAGASSSLGLDSDLASQRRDPSPFERNAHSGRRPEQKLSHKGPAPQMRDPSPFGRNGHSGGTEQKSIHNVSHRRGRQEEREFKQKRGFSWRSLSPFRRSSTKVEEKALLKAQASFRKNQSRSKKAGRPEFRRGQSFGSAGSGGSTPGEILQEEDEMESKIPLVAVTLSDDSSLIRKPKKRFSFRDLSPFRRRKDKQKSKGKNDPFDEGGSSL